VDAADRHVPVKLDRCVELLAPALKNPGSVAIDGTVGLGGHAEALLDRCPQATVIGIDRDPDALALATSRLERFGSRFVPVRDTYDQLPRALAQVGADSADGILLDLGVSSMQIDDSARGFSYRNDAEIDMRMDTSTGLTAADILRDSDEDQLVWILREYGEERYARLIAQAVVTRRRQRPIVRTEDLATVVREAIPPHRNRSGDPAKRTFQALRIAVNDELTLLETALVSALDSLTVGGRVVVMSYHSLEDRLVKHHFALGATDATPQDLPSLRPEDAPYLRALTRGAEQADSEEVAANSRARSVRLRAAERIGPTRHRSAA